jgi:hypothetical protein
VFEDQRQSVGRSWREALNPEGVDYRSSPTSRFVLFSYNP